MLRILFLHLFESLFVWFFVVSRVIRSDEEKAKTLRFTQLKIPDSKFKITCEINLLRHCCAHRGRLQNLRRKRRDKTYPPFSLRHNRRRRTTLLSFYGTPTSSLISLNVILWAHGRFFLRREFLKRERETQNTKNTKMIKM